MSTTFDTQTDWYALWMKQSKIFFDTANEKLHDLFSQEKLNHPEDHLKQIRLWLETLKNQWEMAKSHEQQKNVQAYWNMMMKMYQEASDLLLKQWIKRSQDENPIKSVRELYELWLNCCHETYQKSIRSKAFQDVYGEFFNAAVKYWQSV